MTLAASSTSERTDSIEEIMHTAAHGSKGALYTMARAGGDGAWFALAVLANEWGYSTLAVHLRIQSIRHDPAPYAPRSLVSLLEENPKALSRPLGQILQVEKRHGQSTETRRARIAVLTDLGQEKILRKEMSAYTGAPWEASLLASLFSSEDVTPKDIALLEQFVLSCSDPAALSLLPVQAIEQTAPRIASLWSARTLYAQKAFADASVFYLQWLKQAMEMSEFCAIEGISPVFNEIANVATHTNQHRYWAEWLTRSLSSFSGAKRYSAAYHAGRLFRHEKNYAQAISAFMNAAEALPKSTETDRALWYFLKVIYEDSTVDAIQEREAFAWAASFWYNPEGFSDVMEVFIHRRVSRAEWEVLAEEYALRARRWPAVSRAQAALALAFASAKGHLLTKKPPSAYLDEAMAAAPLSWWGLRAAGLLNKPIIPASHTSRIEDSDEDIIIKTFLKWGLIDKAAEEILSHPTDFADTTIRSVAQALSSTKPRLSIRLAGILLRRQEYSPGIEDLKLRHPLPYGKEAYAAASAKGLPPNIFFGLIRTESAWDTYAVSRTGAKGLTQFMPATWNEWIERLKYPKDSDPSNPKTNLILGASYLSWLRDREWTMHWTDALASYNAGGGRIRSWKRQWPSLDEDLFTMAIPFPEPRAYVPKVLAAATIYGYLYEKSLPGTLHQAWGLAPLSK